MAQWVFYVLIVSVVLATASGLLGFPHQVISHLPGNFFVGKLLADQLVDKRVDVGLGRTRGAQRDHGHAARHRGDRTVTEVSGGVAVGEQRARLLDLQRGLERGRV